MSKRHKISILKKHNHEDASKNSISTLLGYLDNEKYESQVIGIDPLGKWEVSPTDLRYESHIIFPSIHRSEISPSEVYDTLHSHKIPYIGSDPNVHALTENTFLTREILRLAGLDVPKAVLVGKIEWNTDPERLLQNIHHYFGYPVRLSLNLGHSIPLRADNEDSLVEGMDTLLNQGKEVLIEEIQPGTRYVCHVLDHGVSESAFSLEPITLKTEHKKGDAIINTIKKVASWAHRLIDCTSYSTAHLKVTSDNKIIIERIDSSINPEHPENTFYNALERSELPVRSALDILLAPTIRRLR